MDSLENLQRRITEAFERIETAAKSKSEGESIPSDPMRRLAETNVALAAELDAAKARRHRDADEIDRLIAKLKPLLNEVANA